MPRLRVLLLIPTLDRSGAEKQLTLLAAHLPKDEFEVRVIALTRGGPFEADLRAAGIPVTVLGKRFRFDPWPAWRLRREIRAWKPDVLHTWLFAANACGRLVSGRKPPYRIMVSERCVDTWKSRWQLWLDRKLIPRTDLLVANSEAVAEFYRGLGYPAEKVQVIQNGLEFAEPPVVDRAALRKELGFAEDAFLVGYVGRLAEQKRVDDLLWAFELLRVVHPSAGFVVIGDGPTRKGLEHFAEKLQMTPSVRFLGHRHDVPRWLAGLDAFWLASSFEGQSNSLMEAMAAGLPVIASDIPPNRELVTHDREGLIVPVGDRPAFAKAARRLLEDAELRMNLGAAAKERVRANWRVLPMVEAYAAGYRTLAGRPVWNQSTGTERR